MSHKLHQTYFSSSFPITSLQIDGYKVLYEEDKSCLATTFSKSDQKKFQDLLHEAQIHPKSAYPKALDWQAKFSNSKELDNLIAYLHLQNKQHQKAEDLITASFEKYRDYFFAKINYADQCLRKNDLDKIPLIFPSFDLKELFPKKTAFHVSEFRGFMVTVCHYYLKIKKPSLAKQYYENARLADPLHPSVLFLEKRFKKNKILEFFRKIVQLAHIS